MSYKTKRNSDEKDWGSKKTDYYSRNKTNRDDHDFLEEEEEAKKIQMEKLKKLQDANLLESDEESIEKDKVVKRISLDSSEDEEEKKKTVNLFNNNSNKREKNKKSLLSSATKAPERRYSQEELAEFSQILKNIKINVDELNDNVLPIEHVLESDEDLKLTKTLSYFQLKKQAYSMYVTYLSFYLYFKSMGKINDHHPVLKKIYFLKSIMNSDKENKEKIFDKIDKTLELISQKRNLEAAEEEDNELEEAEEDMELGEDVEDEMDLGEDVEEDDFDFDAEGEDSELNAEDIFDLNNDFDENEGKINKGKNQKAKSIENKKHKKSEDNEKTLLKNKRNKPDSILDFDFNIGNEITNKNIKAKKSNGDKNNNNENVDKFVQENIEKLQALTEKKEKLAEKSKRESDELFERKNEMGLRLANKNMLKSRGIYRKRKQYQGNAKLMNREKYMKKQKLRKNMVKEYVGKPEVYGGETTGIRRDLIRSTKFR